MTLEQLVPISPSKLEFFNDYYATLNHKEQQKLDDAIHDIKMEMWARWRDRNGDGTCPISDDDVREIIVATFFWIAKENADV
jgi:hypothetical protein